MRRSDRRWGGRGNENRQQAPREVSPAEDAATTEATGSAAPGGATAGGTGADSPAPGGAAPAGGRPVTHDDADRLIAYMDATERALLAGLTRRALREAGYEGVETGSSLWERAQRQVYLEVLATGLTLQEAEAAAERTAVEDDEESTGNTPD